MSQVIVRVITWYIKHSVYMSFAWLSHQTCAIEPSICQKCDDEFHFHSSKTKSKMSTLTPDGQIHNYIIWILLWWSCMWCLCKEDCAQKWGWAMIWGCLHSNYQKSSVGLLVGSVQRTEMPTIVFAHVHLSILPSVRVSVQNKHFSSCLSVTTLWKILKFRMLIATMMCFNVYFNFLI